MTSITLCGFAGNIGGDGYVTWTTRDDDNSYVPTIHCGHFEIVLLRGWDFVKLVVVEYGAEPDGGDYTHPDELEILWTKDGFVAAVGALAETMDHPSTKNVMDAAREMYFALLQTDWAMIRKEAV